MSELSENMALSDFLNANYLSSNIKYDVDIVFVVDVSGSMKGFFCVFEKLMLGFYDLLTEKLNRKNKEIDILRVKFVFFNDFIECMRDKTNPLIVTDFYNLSDKNSSQMDNLIERISSINPLGGGDIPEDGLEALACAMKSDWCKKVPNHKRRHIIAVFTDAPTHELGFGKMSRDYPGGMPENFDELTQMWGDKLNRAGSMDYISKRLLLFIPKIEYLPVGDGWKDIVEGAMPWENCASYYLDLNNRHKSSTDGEKINMIIDRIVNSI